MVRGTTGLDGKMQTRIRCNGEIHVTAGKAGYYRTQLSPAYEFANKWQALGVASHVGSWSDHPIGIGVRLKKVLNPIPLYVRRLNKSLPTTDQALGFDLVVGDFVNPRGHGKSADVIFTAHVSDRSEDDYDFGLAVSFPNQLDGIVPFHPDSYLSGSALRSPYDAPLTGYQPTLIVKRSRRPGEPEVSNYDPRRHGYFFRIHTVADSTGKLISANYGKIYGDFMNFTYYLNPTPNDRNVEFDPKHNLFTNLKPEEQVTEP
jgi:hypothetical protein